jgi:hypothetical protein
MGDGGAHAQMMMVGVYTVSEANRAGACDGHGGAGVLAWIQWECTTARRRRSA